jgi:uncharacterized DUF497 family protein
MTRPDDPNDAEAVEWDEHNMDHLAKHAITPIDVHDVFESALVWISNTRDANDRWKVIGLDRGGRVLTVVCAYSSTRRALRPITGWRTTTGERNKYLKEVGR